MSSPDDVGDLLSAASQATDPTVRRALVAEARVRIAREAERLRELARSLAAFEAELSIAG